MATLQDIQQRETELNQIESQANQILSTQKIPQRRFGSGVTREQQQAVIQNRDKAQTALAQVQQQRQELSKVKVEIQQQEAQYQKQVQYIQKQNSSYEYGRKLGLRGDAPVGLNREAQQGYNDARSGIDASEERSAQLSKLKSQGITPVYTNGKLVGFQDSVRGQSIGLNEVTNLDVQSLQRYEKAGVVTSTPSQQLQSSANSLVYIPSGLPTLNEQLAQGSLIQVSRDVYINAAYAPTKTVSGLNLFSSSTPTLKEQLAQMSIPGNEKYINAKRDVTIELKQNGFNGDSGNSRNIVGSSGLLGRAKTNINAAGTFVQKTSQTAVQEFQGYLQGIARSSFESSASSVFSLNKRQPLNLITPSFLPNAYAEQLAFSKKYDDQLKKYTGATYSQARASEINTALIGINVPSGIFYTLTGGQTYTTKAVSGLNKEELSPYYQRKLNVEINAFNKEVEKYNTSPTEEVYKNLTAKEVSLKQLEEKYKAAPITLKEIGYTALPAVASGVAFGGGVSLFKGSKALLGFEGKNVVGKTIGSGIDIYFKAEIAKSVVNVGGNIANKNYKGAALGGIELSSAIAGYGISQKVVGKGFEFANKEKNIQITEPIKEYNSLSMQVLEIPAEGGRGKVKAQFQVLQTEQARVSYKVKNFDIYLEKFLGSFVETGYPKSLQTKKLTPESLELLQTKYPRGRLALYSKPSKAISYTEPFNVNFRGEITSPAGRTKGFPNVFSISAKKRLGGRTSYSLSSIQGFTEPIEYKVGNVRDSLSKSNKELLNKIEEVYKSKDISVTGKLDKDLKINLGEITSKENAKIFKGGLRFTSPGKRTTRGQVLGVQKEMVNIQFEGKDRLKEYQESIELVGVSDVTFPKVTKGTKPILIKGIAKSYTLESPPIPADIKVFYGGYGKKSSPKYLQDLYNVQQLKFVSSNQIQKQIGSTTLSLSKQRTSPVIYKQEPVQAYTSAYAGTGMYERTNSIASFKELPIQKFTMDLSYPTLTGVKSFDVMKDNSLLKIATKQSIKERQREALKEVQREMLKVNTRVLDKLTDKMVYKEMLKPLQKQQSKLIQREIMRPLSKLIPSPLKFEYKNPPPKKSMKKFIFGFDKSSKLNTGKEVGYKSYVIQKGRKKYLSSILPRGLALRKGESEALRTLRATFGIEPTKFSVKRKDVSFIPKQNIFRNYRIKKGRAIPLTDEFIQRRGKRLVSQGEVSAIQLARQLKRR